ncbi:MAG: hypothetical protein JWL85_205 [Candidatus Saccharibacteria bacterium]|nr:hypothetical protein [Candidatus Saccharibacteria bacterium]
MGLQAATPAPCPGRTKGSWAILADLILICRQGESLKIIHETLSESLLHHNPGSTYP